MRALVVVALVAGCKGPVAPGPDADASAPDAATPASMDAGPPTRCVAACANLRRLGCPEGEERDAGGCGAVCGHAAASRSFDLKPDCLAKAATVDEARACGTVLCRK